MTTAAPVQEPVLVQDEQNEDNPVVEKSKSPAKVRIEDNRPPKPGSQSEPRPGRPTSATQKEKGFVNGKPNWVTTSQYADSRYLFSFLFFE